MATEPTKVTIRMFVVGFGDCFLLTFHYDLPLRDQSILIDFGTAGGNADMKGIAKKIHEVCGGKLYAVVATHRHKDHISGFSDKGGKDSPGAIIASCKPEVVIQPWTEDPKAGANATSAALLGKGQPKNAAQVYFASLNFDAGLCASRGGSSAPMARAGRRANSPRKARRQQYHELGGGA